MPIELFVPWVVVGLGMFFIPMLFEQNSNRSHQCHARRCLRAQAHGSGLCAKHAHHLLVGKSHVDVNVSEDELLFESPREWVKKAEDAEQKRWENPVGGIGPPGSQPSPARISGWVPAVNHTSNITTGLNFINPSYFDRTRRDLQILKNDVEQVQRKLRALDP